MTRITASLSVALLSFVAAACNGYKSPTTPAPVPSPAASTYNLTGSVVEETGSGSMPAAGAHIDVSFGDGGHLSAIAGSDGRYVIAGVPTGSATVSVTQDGFASEETQVQLSADMTLDFDLKANQ